MLNSKRVASHRRGLNILVLGGERLDGYHIPCAARMRYVPGRDGWEYQVCQALVRQHRRICNAIE